jgi:hypothetical protein
MDKDDEKQMHDRSRLVDGGIGRGIARRPTDRLDRSISTTDRLDRPTALDRPRPPSSESSGRRARSRARSARRTNGPTDGRTDGTERTDRTTDRTDRTLSRARSFARFFDRGARAREREI